MTSKEAMIALMGGIHPSGLLFRFSSDDGIGTFIFLLTGLIGVMNEVEI